jgi:hypothetical protein
MRMEIQLSKLEYVVVVVAIVAIGACGEPAPKNNPAPEMAAMKKTLKRLDKLERSLNVELLKLKKRVTALDKFVRLIRDLAFDTDSGLVAEAATSIEPIPSPKLAPKLLPNITSAELDSIAQGTPVQLAIVDSAQLIKLLNSPKLLSQSPRISRYSKNGRPFGFKINGIHLDSIYDYIGLHNGDVLHGVNGVWINTPERLLHACEELPNHERIVLSVLHQGKKRVFDVHIK